MILCHKQRHTIACYIIFITIPIACLTRMCELHHCPLLCLIQNEFRRIFVDKTLCLLIIAANTQSSCCIPCLHFLPVHKAMLCKDLMVIRKTMRVNDDIRNDTRCSLWHILRLQNHSTGSLLAMP